MRKIRKVGWFLPGFLLWAAFPPMGEKVDVLFALAPLLWLSRQGDARRAMRGWLMSGALFWLATLAWMPAIVKNGGPWPLVALGWFALSAYCTAYLVTFGWLSARTWAWANDANGGYGRRLFAIFVAEPVLWCGLELVRSRFLGGFAWNQLGVVAVNGGFGAPAAWGGVYLLSAVIVLINGTAAGILERLIASIRRRPVSRLRSLETVLAFAVVWCLYALPHHQESLEKGTPVKVALIQRNFPCAFQSQESNPYIIYGDLFGHIANLKPELLVMGESALCEFGPVDQQGAMRFARWARERTGALAVLAGGTRHGDGQTYNSAALYTENELSVYDKVHLVPFGEFIPGDKWIASLQRLAPVGSCTPGELKVLKLKLPMREISLGVAICFEDTDSAQMRRLASSGAELLVFITNDSWFSHSNETVQHAWQATARAIETGLPVVRVGNSGVTGTISPEGVPSWLQDAKGRPMVDRRGTMFDRLLLAPRKPTPYVCVGDWPLGIAFLLLILVIILVQYTDNHEKRKYLSL